MHETRIHQIVARQLCIHRTPPPRSNAAIRNIPGNRSMGGEMIDLSIVQIPTYVQRTQPAGANRHSTHPIGTPLRTHRAE